MLLNEGVSLIGNERVQIPISEGTFNDDSRWKFVEEMATSTPPLQPPPAPFLSQHHPNVKQFQTFRELRTTEYALIREMRGGEAEGIIVNVKGLQSRSFLVRHEEIKCAHRELPDYSRTGRMDAATADMITGE